MERPVSGTSRLGRGLGSLLPRTSGVDEVDLDLIVPNPRQPRGVVAPAQLAELVESVRTHGILLPLLVSRRVSESGVVTYQLVAGERRLRAARTAGLRRVPVVVRETSPQELLELALVENVQRADLNALEEAFAYRQLIDEFGLTQEDVARRVGKSRVTIANALRLLGLPEPVRESLAAREISEGHARALLGAPDHAALLDAWHEVVDRSLTVRQTEESVRRLRDAPAVSTPTSLAAPRARATEKRVAPADAELAALEDQLQRSLNTQVRIERSRRGGRLVIRFYGDEDLNALLERLLGGGT